MKQKILSKLRSKAGDSIGEVLVSLLIASLALVMLASMITSSTRMIQRSRERMEEYYQANNSLSTYTTPDDGSDISVISKNATISISFVNGSSTTTSAAEQEVTLYVNQEIGGKEVISYKKG